MLRDPDLPILESNQKILIYRISHIKTANIDASYR